MKSRLVVAAALIVTLGAFLFGALKTYRVLGLHDVELVFRADKPLENPEWVARELRFRLSALEEYGADITPTKDGVRVVVESKLAPLVTDVVTWDGKLTAHRIDRDYALPSYVGSIDEVTKAVRGIDVGNERRLVIAHVPGKKLYRAVVISEEDALATPIHPLDEWTTPNGRGVRITIVKSEAEELRKLGDPSTYALTGGKLFALLDPAITDDAIVASCGDDLRAYRRAKRDMELVAAGTIPALRAEPSRSLAKDLKLAASHLAIPLLVAATWFAIVRRFDRAQPEPWWLVLATGAIAMAINPLTFVIRSPLTGTDWGDPHLADHAGRLEAFPQALLAYSLEAGGVEELMKLLPILVLARWRREFDEPIDGIIYGAASAVGFSCIEEFGYLHLGRLHASILVGRATSTPPAHVFFTAVMGYALGQGIGKGLRGVPRVVFGYLAAAFLHGLFDTLVTFRELHVVSLGYQLALLFLFTYLVRRALRGSSAVLAPSKHAKLVRAGSWVAFLLSTILFAIAVSSLREVGSLPGPTSTLSSNQILGLGVVLSVSIALIALRMVSSVPLDVVLDETGLTFSGVTLPWSTIGSAHETGAGNFILARRRIILDTSKGPYTIGPLSTANAAMVLAEVSIRCVKPSSA